jgi:hypothetical protein
MPVVLMFVLWYCYKRGREERLEKEKSAGEVSGDGAEGSDREGQSADVVDPDHRLEAPPSTDSPGPTTATQDTPR